MLWQKIFEPYTYQYKLARLRLVLWSSSLPCRYPDGPIEIYSLYYLEKLFEKNQNISDKSYKLRPKNPKL